MTLQSGQLVDNLQSEYGETLRVIATYDRDGYEIHYAGQGIDANYSEVDLDNIYDDVVMQDVSHGFVDDLFNDLGDVRGQLRIFENGIVAHFWPTETKRGVFLTFDSSADPSMRSLLELISGFYN